jgi:hypothetical protein
MRSTPVLTALLLAALTLPTQAAEWDGYAGNAQHTALSTVASQSLQTIHWQTPVDLDPLLIDDDLLIHYGSPVITPNNTVIVPVKTSSDSFELQAFNGVTGALQWTQPTDYTLPPQGQGASYFWTPSYSPTLATSNTLYYAGAGGTVYKRSALDTSAAVAPTQEAFYAPLASYQANQAAYNAGIAISTPITADNQGNIYFGYQTSGSAPGGITNGIARISSTGVGTFFEASQVHSTGMALTQVVTNSAPALSPDGSTVYVAMSTGNNGTGALVALNAATLSPTASTPLIDPQTGRGAILPNDGTASPMVGPDGDVYMGVLDDAGTSRGFMEHYSANLAVTKPTGAFGWDDTASIVPASMVPSYHGTSSYLIMTKYNNYAETGGDGINRIAILDPNATQLDTRANSTHTEVMQEVLTISSPSGDEWCINTAVVDPATDSILVNNEDGNLYRWNLATDTLTESLTLSSGIGEAYTPTLMGPDGTVYAISDATLFAVGAAPEPATLALLLPAALLLAPRRFKYHVH